MADCIAEVREAVDFCRYYAQQAEEHLATGQKMPGPTGESNYLYNQGRGVFVCISPWNFPLAIYTGQIAAALVAGNTVIAKPAEQTPLIAHETAKLFHAAGVPESVLQVIPGDGAQVGAPLTASPDIAGVAFTGSTETAQIINKTLAARTGPIAQFIAETGGQNCFIADSSALPEQLVKDIIASAFTSAGQRCSAARVLYIQDDIADKVLTMLAGAMAELRNDHPKYVSTDVGPLIDKDARATLENHAARMQREAKIVQKLENPPLNGTFFPPHVAEIPSVSVLEREVFGPFLHVVRFKANELDKVIDDINATGYGLTFGIHSRIDETIEHVISHIQAGNCYINRNTIGAVVGVQPFGGMGLSGTGPKAGGPQYLHAFSTEKTVTNNIAAVGGNAELLELSEDE